MGANGSYTVVSYYTAGTLYMNESKNLERSLVQFGIPYCIRPIENTGTWVRNCSQKGRFVRDMLLEFGSPVLWLDADALVVEEISIFDDPDFEFAVHKNIQGNFMSGTVYVHPNAIHLMNTWAELCHKSPDTWDQILLQKAWDSERHKPKTHLLDMRYCTRFDDRNRPANPAIIHNQASRRLKKSVERSFEALRKVAIS